MNIVNNLWQKLNKLVPEPQCKTKNNDYDLIVWDDARPQPTLDEVQTVVFDNDKAAFNRSIDAELLMLDLKFIRAAREELAAMSNTSQRIKDLETEAQSKRAQKQ